VVVIVSRLRAERSGVRIQVREINFSVLKNIQIASGSIPAYSSAGIAFFPEGKAAGA
jgi:hypothetical protein